MRTTSEIKYITGDEVYYKRDDYAKWRGPGKVIGQLGQQYFVKHGAFYVRVHPCRLQLVGDGNPVAPSSTTSSSSTPVSSLQNPTSGVPPPESDKSDDDENESPAITQSRNQNQQETSQTSSGTHASNPHNENGTELAHSSDIPRSSTSSIEPNHSRNTRQLQQISLMSTEEPKLDTGTVTTNPG